MLEEIARIPELEKTIQRQTMFLSESKTEVCRLNRIIEHISQKVSNGSE